MCVCVSGGWVGVIVCEGEWVGATTSTILLCMM